MKGDFYTEPDEKLEDNSTENVGGEKDPKDDEEADA